MVLQKYEINVILAIWSSTDTEVQKYFYSLID